MDIITLSNVRPEAGAIAAPFILMWLFSGIIYYLYYRLCESVRFVLPRLPRVDG